MQKMFNKGMPKRHALQMEMTEWIYHLNEVQKTDVLSFLCAHVPWPWKTPRSPTNTCGLLLRTRTRRAEPGHLRLLTS